MRLKKRLIAHTPLGPLFTVDGGAMRHLDTSAIGGAHHMVHPVVPGREIWIERGLGSDGRFIAAHELAEIHDMRAFGWSYRKAHNKANRMERELRLAWARGHRSISAIERIIRPYQPVRALLIAHVVVEWSRSCSSR